MAKSKGVSTPNALYYGDNLEVLRRDIATESVDLIYLDPPFNSNRSYNVLFKHKTGDEAQAQIEAFDDTWTWSQEAEREYSELIGGHAPAKVADAIEAMRRLLGENDVLAYLVMMTARLVELHRVLKPTGSLYLHCDPTASHYLKIMLDTIFGPQNFRNEVIWKRKTGRGATQHKPIRFGVANDNILFYAKSRATPFHESHKPNDPEYIKKFFKHVDENGRRYQTDNLASPSMRPNLVYDYKGYPPPRFGWAISREKMEQWDAQGRLEFPKNPTGRIRRRRYLDEHPGQTVDSIWEDVRPIAAQANERLGYPTQKPLALLERIINVSSNPGDVVLDPFCGCGTAVDAAQKLGRLWIGIDVTYLSIDLIDKRLRHSHGEGVAASYEIVGIPRDVDGARALFKRNPFEFERWAVSMVDGQPNEKQVGDKGIDGVIRYPTDAKGGTGRILVSVKGGKQLNPEMVRDLIGTVHSQRADMGVLITMEAPTPGMVDAAKHSGSFRAVAQGREYDVAQIVTIGQLLSGQRPNLPPILLPYVQAQRHAIDPGQLRLGE